MKAKDIIQIMENWAPLFLAESKWDNVGLQMGSREKEVRRLLLCLDVSKGAVQKALSQNTDMILSHHPLFFKTLRHIDTETLKGQMIRDLLLKDITLYSAHTNLDAAKDGVSYVLANLLGLQEISLLHQTKEKPLYKLGVFVPKTHASVVQKAMLDKGAGHVGAYSHCSFSLEGEGTFMPLAGAKPFIGTENEMSRVQEVKIETVLPEEKVGDVILAMKKAHPYEEAAYDLYVLQNQKERYGYGCVGLLNKPMRLLDLAAWIRETLQVSDLRYAGDPQSIISKVALSGGDGTDFIESAAQSGAQVFITGDLRHHDVQLAMEQGIFLIDAGHYDTEKHILKAMAKRLKPQMKEVEIDLYEENEYEFCRPE